ncbi:MAG: lipopolysaccharide heptosyltransferase II [Gammaproteobacteria bacterium]|nr:lipopolysaccharide heptosyltransferase II [Gammaproteobacteria bacterium]NND36005.1 lipopolysaccharide heptosyltransferase II [Gammaproteobacteria bacterium]
MSSADERILIAGPAWVGDMVMAQSLFKLLREKSPGAVIDVVAPAWSEPILDRMAEVHRTVTLPVGHGELKLAERYRVGRSLRAERYTRAIVMPRSLKAALVPFFAAIPLRTGFRGEMRYGLLNDVRRLDKSRLDQTVKRFMALGLPPDAALPYPPYPELATDAGNRARFAAQLGGEATDVVALMPGAAYGPAKCWPLEYFGQLAAALAADGTAVVVLGAKGEYEVGERIRAAGGDGVFNLCGETRLEETVDVLSMARAAVTNDSGLMHVAAAAGTHVVAIYGSSSPDFTPPLTDSKTIISLGIECSPCFERECPLGHLHCLRDISPDRVLADVRSVPAPAPGPLSP